MAKKQPKQSPKDFVAEVATNPEKLGKFILDPEGTMNEAKISKKDQIHVKSAIAHHVHLQLATPPEAFFVI